MDIENEEEDYLPPEEIAMRKFEEKITFVESLVTLINGDKKMTPSSMLISLMDDVHMRDYAIHITESKSWEMFVRRCIQLYEMKNGTWVQHLKKYYFRVLNSKNKKNKKIT